MDRSNPSTFKLSFPKIPYSDDIRDNAPFLLHVHETVLPDITIEPNENHWKGNKSYGSGLGIEYGTWNTLFYIDEDFLNWTLLYNWMMGIINGQDDFHPERALDNQIDSSLIVMDNFQNVIKEFEFINIWPSTLGEVTLSYQDSDVFLTCSVTFLYDYFKPKE